MGSVVAQPPPRAAPQPTPSLRVAMGIIPTLRERRMGRGGSPLPLRPGQRLRPPWGPEGLAILFIFERIPGCAGKRNTEFLVHVISSLTRPTRTATCLPGRGRADWPSLAAGGPACPRAPALASPGTWQCRGPRNRAESLHREQRGGRRAWRGAEPTSLACTLEPPDCPAWLEPGPARELVKGPLGEGVGSGLCFLK